MVGELVRSAPVAAMQPDDETWPAAAEGEACKLGLFALVRLRAFDPLAAAVLENGRPISDWWPIAYALQRVDDKRAAPVFAELLKSRGRYTRAFAARGLGALRDASAGPALTALLEPAVKSGLEVSVQAIRAIGQINYADGAAALMKVAANTTTHPNLRLEAVNAVGALRSSEALPLLYELMTESWAAMRSAAMQAAARTDADAFVLVLASLEPDRDWRVRSTLATILGTLPPEIGLDRLRGMLADADKRVRPAVMTALARLKAPDLAKILFEQLQDPDFGVRSAAARQLGQLKPAGAADALRAAYKAAEPDSAIDARATALEALAELGAAEATETLRAALADKDWAIRVRASQLLARLEAGSIDSTATVSAELDEAIRPVPASPTAPYDDPQLIAPEFSPHVFIETAHGTIEFELAVLDAPQTTRNFMELARKGFFNGLEVHRVVPNFVVQDGDPRGDGEGGPGYTIRDELNDRPYLRGTVGMALSWADTGGSQFFITHSPQPHLDGRYTAFGRVVNGMDVVDQIKAGDVIQRVRVWDGKGWQ
jgi:cyclophilin family peptidyl-prolyl cis-trans isomerase/HEAT repeat protein